MIISLFSGCGILQKLGLGGSKNDELQPASSIVMNEEEAKKLTDKVPIHLYFANADNTKLKLEVRYIPLSEAKKSVNNLASIIVKELIKGPGQGSDLKPTIPSGVQLRSPVSINAGIATVDFSKEFIDNHPGGSTAEKLTIYSVVNSLTELKEIEKVKFTINGKTQKDFKGSFQFDAPFPRSTSIISKEAPAVSSTTNENAPDAAKETQSSTQKNSVPSKANESTGKDSDKNQQDTTKQGTTKQSETKPGSTKPGDQGIQSGIDASQETSSQEEDEATYLETLE
jgi:hypothetical protein